MPEKVKLKKNRLRACRLMMCHSRKSPAFARIAAGPVGCVCSLSAIG
jgi:hypothetical protein